MWQAAIPPAHLEQAVTQFIRVSPMSFVQLMRVLPQLKGAEDLALPSGLILWRGLSEGGVAALRNLHAEGAIFFWLCSPAVYARTGDVPLMRLMSRSHQPGEQRWLPTLIHDRAPTAAESRESVKEYVAELGRYLIPAF